ncbi:MAG: hypothetical protein HGA16_03135 [Candidatus Moranbacteria bacterium]|nr:hypothetical protein [Candidatus Moranbacteria bacterium]
MRKVAYLVRNLFGDLVPDPMKGRAFGGDQSPQGNATSLTGIDMPFVGLRAVFGYDLVLPGEIERGTNKPYDEQHDFGSGIEHLRKSLEQEGEKREISLIIPGPNGALCSEQLSMSYQRHFSPNGQELRTWIKGSNEITRPGEKGWYFESVLKHAGGIACFGYYVVTVAPFDMRRADEYANLAETLWILIAFRAAKGESLLKEGGSVMTSSCCERMPDRMIVDVTPEGIEPSYLSRDGHVPSVAFIVSHVSMHK